MISIGRYVSMTVATIAVLASCSAPTGAAHGDVSLHPSGPTTGHHGTKATAASSNTVDRRLYARCGPRSLRGLMREGFSPLTGEHGFILQVENDRRAPCSVRGYPAVAFTTRDGESLPFKEVDGRGPYVTHNPPRWVNLGPGGRADVEIAKYRCDLGIVAKARHAELTFPGGATVSARLSGQLFGYCGRGDPGSTVGVSPLAATEHDLLRDL